ncbi:MAG: redoxin domain-containing protein [Acidobacteria bacterium]|uniref:Redoxin domain-containing protein n=1 Tax=Candidatus Polarisedimenticola svalbardensis TaxID=2886004 RepID=A0A8J6Y0R6_9BACT|nr:redoxin domain-containing protein [Candidatus Polarisedimenticola svalbardensis]
MIPGYRKVATALILVLAGIALSLGPALGQSKTSQDVVRVERASFGEPFPAFTFKNLNQGAGGPASIDLATVIGQKPIVLYYFIAKNQRAEKIFREVQSLTDELGPKKIALFGVAVSRPGMAAGAIRERAAALKIHVPILEDEGFRLGQQLAVSRVPNISLIDKDGILRMVNGGSLLQVLEYKLSLADGIRRLAETGKIGTYAALTDYSPSVEMVGRTAPDFKAPSIRNGSVQQWSGLYSKDTINLLIFWSVNCPHCTKALPQYNKWYRENRDKVNIVTAARITNPAERTKTREFVSAQKLEFLTVEDQDRAVADLYNVTATPTIFVVGPDGKVDSLLSAKVAGFGEKVEAKHKQLVK